MNMRWWMIVAVLSGMALPVAAEDLTFVETFDDDPVAAGRFLVRGDPSRFVHAPGSMTASYDTAAPTAILYHRLLQPVGACTDFVLEVDLTILSAGFLADPSAFAQIAFGLINTQATGDDRAGGTGGDAYEIMTVDYFPNESFLFGGPTLTPTLITADVGGSFFNAIRFTSGPETDMTTEGPLPLDVPLTFRLAGACDPGTGEQTLTLAVDGPGGPIPINAEGKGLQAGGPDGDPTTIQTVVANPALVVDALAITLWEDTFLFGPPASLVADVRFDEMRLTVSGLPAVPTVPPWGMLVLASLIVAAGAVVLRRSPLDESGAIRTARVTGRPTPATSPTVR